MASGIYIITNKINNKVYIGQSNDIVKRLQQHRSMLKSSKHYNFHLQCAFNKHGLDNFMFEVLELCELESRDDREKYHIDLYQSNKPEYGYNSESGGHVGKVLSEEHKINISNANKGKYRTDESKRKMSDAHKGRRLSEETKRKLSEINKRNGNKPPVHYGQTHSRGRKHSEETKRKIGEKSKGRKHNLGRKFSEEHKQKISDSLKGNKYNLGRKLPEEHRRKISEALKLDIDNVGRFKKGFTPHNKVQATEGMFADILNGITQSSFVRKYKRDSKVFKRIKQELLARGGEY